MVHRLLAFLVLLAAATAIVACGDNANDSDPTRTPAAPTAAAAGFPLTITRSDGKTHTLQAAPQRVVSLSPGGTEIVYALGAGDSLVAVDNNADYPQEVAAISGRIDAYEPNVEAIAGFNPDLVIVATDSGGIVDALDQLNIPLLYQDLDSSVTTIDDVLALIKTYGDVFDRADEAEALVSDLQGRVDDVLKKLSKQGAHTPMKVYHELDSTYYSASKDTFIGDIYTKLGLENIAASSGGVTYPQLTQEAIIGANPDVIVLADEEFGVSADDVKARPGWDAISAVKNDRIYSVDPDIISRPGPRIVDALEQLARDIYPEQFQ